MDHNLNTQTALDLMNHDAARVCSEFNKDRTDEVYTSLKFLVHTTGGNFRSNYLATLKAAMTDIRKTFNGPVLKEVRPVVIMDATSMEFGDRAVLKFLVNHAGRKE